MEKAEAPILLPTVSADGKRNAFYHNCKPLEQQRAYAACLNIIERHDRGELHAMYSSCDTAIRHGQCKAVGMREQEQLQGKAIFFMERSTMAIHSGAADAMRRFFDSLKDMAKGVFVPEPKKKDVLSAIGETPTYADVITKMAREETDADADRLSDTHRIVKERSATKVLAPKINMLPGETPLDAVRRMQREQSLTKE